MKIGFGILLLVSHLILGMEQQQEGMTTIQKWQQAKPFEGKFVAYKPSFSLGEYHMHQLDPNNHLNYGYIQPRLVARGQDADIAMPYLYLYILAKRQEDVLPSLISDQTLSRKELVLRLATVQEIKNIKSVMQTEDVKLFCQPRTGFIACMHYNYTDISPIIDEQLVKLQRK